MCMSPKELGEAATAVLAQATVACMENERVLSLLRTISRANYGVFTRNWITHS